MKKEKNKQLDSEDKIQSQFHQWLWNEFPLTRQLCYHIPNGGYRGERAGNKFKAMGVVAGIPDYHIAIANHGYNSLYIEFKEPGANMNTDHVKHQESVQEKLRIAKNKVIVCHCLSDAQIELMNYLPECYIPVDKARLWNKQ